MIPKTPFDRSSFPSFRLPVLSCYLSRECAYLTSSYRYRASQRGNYSVSHKSLKYLPAVFTRFFLFSTLIRFSYNRPIMWNGWRRQLVKWRNQLFVPHTNEKISLGRNISIIVTSPRKLKKKLLYNLLISLTNNQDIRSQIANY